METSIFLAKLLGIYLLFEGLLLFTRRRTLVQVIRHFMNDVSNTYITGLFIFVVGLLIVLIHPVFRGWEVLITIIGWIVLLKGIFYTAFPARILKKVAEATSSQGWFTLGGIVTLAVGAFLALRGFGVL